MADNATSEGSATVMANPTPYRREGSVSSLHDAASDVSTEEAGMNSKSMAGWIGFAGMLMLIIGSIDFFQGLIALFEDEYFVVTASGFLVVDLTALGLDHVDLGRAARSRRPRTRSRRRGGRAGLRSWSCP